MTDEINSKLGEISTKIDILQQNQEKHTSMLMEQSQTLLRNTITVETHEKRSTLLEAEVKSIQLHVNNVKAVGKAAKWFGVFIASTISAAASIYEILSYLGKLGK